MAKGLPYDGWYNGNVKLMILNGTYADFRDVLEEKLKLGKIKPERLKEHDDEWAKVPLEEKQRRRAQVIDDSTPKEKVYQTPKGEVRVMRAKPSNNNNADPSKPKREKAKAKVKLPPGALTNENSPLVTEATPPAAQ